MQCLRRSNEEETSAYTSSSQPANCRNGKFDHYC